MYKFLEYLHIKYMSNLQLLDRCSGVISQRSRVSQKFPQCFHSSAQLQANIGTLLC